MPGTRAGSSSSSEETRISCAMDAICGAKCTQCSIPASEGQPCSSAVNSAKLVAADSVFESKVIPSQPHRNDLDAEEGENVYDAIMRELAEMDSLEGQGLEGPTDPKDGVSLSVGVRGHTNNTLGDSGLATHLEKPRVPSSERRPCNSIPTSFSSSSSTTSDTDTDDDEDSTTGYPQADGTNTTNEEPDEIASLRPSAHTSDTETSPSPGPTVLDTYYQKLWSIVDLIYKTDGLRGLKNPTMNPWAALFVGFKIGYEDQPPTAPTPLPVSKDRIEEMKMEMGLLLGFSETIRKNLQLTDEELDVWVYDTYMHFQARPGVEFGRNELKASFFTSAPSDAPLPGPSTSMAPTICLSSRPFKRRHEDVSTPHPATGRPAKLRIIQESVIHAYYVEDTD